MRWMNGVGRAVVVVATWTALGLTEFAMAIVTSGTVFADSYTVSDAGRVYSVVDLYIKCSNANDIISSTFGVSAYVSSYVQNSGLPFVQSMSGIPTTSGAPVSSWLPVNDDGKDWDSFVTCGCRDQGSATTLVSGKAGFLGLQLDTNWASSSSGGRIVGQAGGPGWFPGIGASTSANPYAKVGVYVGSAAGLARCGSTVTGNGIVYGQTLEKYWMIGRFAIDVTGDYSSSARSMTVNFAIAGKNNGTTTFTGATQSAGRFSTTIAMRPNEICPPETVSATDGTRTDAVEIQYNSSIGGQWGNYGGGAGVWPSKSYEIIRVAPDGTTVSIPSGNSDLTAVPGTKYLYYVRCTLSIYYTGSGYQEVQTSGLSRPETGWRKLSPPSEFAGSFVTSDGANHLSWQSAVGATGYRLFRSVGTEQPLDLGVVAGTSFVDNTVVRGTAYRYLIQSECTLGPSDQAAPVTVFAGIDCDQNGLDDFEELYPSTAAQTGNMGSLQGTIQRTAYLTVARPVVSDVTIAVDAIGDLDSQDEYVLMRLSNPPAQASGIVRNLFVSDGLACPATPQRSTISISKDEFNGLFTSWPGTLKVDFVPMPAVGGADSTCQDRSSVSMVLSYRVSNPAVDCNSNGLLDACEMLNGAVSDCNQNRVPDSCEISSGGAIDCNGNGVIDSCEIASGAATDCNSNGIPDSCDIASGLETDLNGNGKADRCEYLVGSPAWPTVAGAVSAAPAGGTVLVLPGTYDGPVDLGSKGLTLRSTGGKGNTTIRAAAGATAIRVAGGGRVEGFFIQGGAGDTQTGTRRGGAMVITGGDVTVKDCDLRAGDTGSAGEGGLVFIRDAQPTFDTCRLEFGFAGSGGGVYAIASDAAQHAPVFNNCIVRSNNAGIGGGMLLRGSGMRPVLQGVLFELNQASGAGGALAMLDGARPTLNGCEACGNTAVVVSGAYDVAGALSYLTDDCNGDGVCDADQIAAGQLTDLDVDGIPDTCQDCDGDGYSDRYAIAQGMVPDCDGNLVPDACDLAAGAPDCNGNGVPDACDARSTALDCNRDGVLDSCQALADCNANGVPDVCDIAGGLLPDCNRNGVPDGCEVASGAAPDCNANGIPDACDIAAGREEDQDGGGVPDACQYAVGDLDLDGATNTGDLAFILLLFDSPGPIGDLDGDGMVSTADVSLMLLYFE